MATSLIWLDGRICSTDEFRILPTDEVLLYGRGLFETTRTVAGRPWLWDRHRMRALSTAQTIGIDLSSEVLPTVDEVTEFVKQVSQEDVVVRLSVGMGTKKTDRNVWMMARPLPASTHAVSLLTSRHRVSRSDELAGLKTNNYLLRQLAFEEATANAASKSSTDALLLSTDGEVLETAHSNIFARFGEDWWTPPIAGGVLPGTVRSLLLEHAESVRIIEKSIHINDLSRCDEAVVTNSVRGVVPVAAIDGRPLNQTALTEPLTGVITRSQTEVR